MHEKQDLSPYQKWIGRYANCKFDYFGRHDQGRAIDYSFNSLGYRGPEHHAAPDITIFGSSFSFGVGIEYHQCWHQLLGNYRINCIATAGFLATNDDIVDHYKTAVPSTGRVIVQLRESRYNRGPLDIPKAAIIFAVDENPQPGILTMTWSSFIDKAEDGIHPGINTHRAWAKIIKNAFSL